MAAQPDSVIQELSRLHISHMTPQQYSPLRGKKIAPVVPPQAQEGYPRTRTARKLACARCNIR
ncbi:hypothetical protein MRX96_028823 [Rhipicephalus microplus]